MVAFVSPCRIQLAHGLGRATPLGADLREPLDVAREPSMTGGGNAVADAAYGPSLDERLDRQPRHGRRLDQPPVAVAGRNLDFRP